MKQLATTQFEEIIDSMRIQHKKIIVRWFLIYRLNELVHLSFAREMRRKTFQILFINSWSHKIRKTIVHNVPQFLGAHNEGRLRILDL